MRSAGFGRPLASRRGVTSAQHSPSTARTGGGCLSPLAQVGHAVSHPRAGHLARHFLPLSRGLQNGARLLSGRRKPLRPAAG